MNNEGYNIFSKNNNVNLTCEREEEFFGNAIDKGFIPKNGLSGPLFAMWEITGKCPQNCIYCYDNSPRKVEELSSKRMFELADELINTGIFQVCITGGEPTMREEYFDLIRYFVTNGVAVGTILSGANITKSTAYKIARYVKSVQVSLDGSKPEIHDFVRNRRGSFNDVINTIKYFVNIGTEVRVSFALTKYNIDDFENTYNLCKELGVKSIRTQKLAVSGKVKGNENSIYASDEQIENLERFIEKQKKSKSKTIIEYRSPYGHVELGLKTGFVMMARITAEGDVGITPYVDAYFGNVKEEKFLDIWNRMRRGWSNEEMRSIANKSIKRKNGVLVDPLKSKKMLV